MIALMLSSVVIILVSTTFLIQNQYYSTQILATGAYDNARATTELVASKIRSVMESGIRVTGKKTLTIRTPMTMMVVCDIGASHATMYFVGGIVGLDTTEVGGAATRDTLTGNWTYGNSNWSALNRGGGTPSVDCADNGADTASVASDFYRLQKAEFSTLFGADPEVGDVIILFRETTFKFQTSVMDTTTVGLFRQAYGDSLIEYATGMDTTAQFQYRIGTSYGDTAFSFLLGNVDAIRIVAEARKKAKTGGVDDVMYRMVGEHRAEELPLERVALAGGPAKEPTQRNGLPTKPVLAKCGSYGHDGPAPLSAGQWAECAMAQVLQG